MIKNTIELLSLYDYYNVSKRVDVAKGFNEIPSNWKAANQLIKRILWRKKL